MRKTFFLLILCALTAIPLKGDTGLTSYSNAEYGYSAMVPSSWERSEIDFRYKHVLFLRSNKNIEIKITAGKSSHEEIIRWNRWKDWHLEGKSVNLMTIFESADISFDADSASKVVVFECGINGSRYIKKISVKKRGDILISVEASCPYHLYYKYSGMINGALSEIKIEKIAQGGT